MTFVKVKNETRQPSGDIEKDRCFDAVVEPPDAIAKKAVDVNHQLGAAGNNGFELAAVQEQTAGCLARDCGELTAPAVEDGNNAEDMPTPIRRDRAASTVLGFHNGNDGSRKDVIHAVASIAFTEDDFASLPILADGSLPNTAHLGFREWQ